MSAGVYFITNDHGQVKIGKASNIDQRLRTIQTSNHATLRVAWLAEIDSPALRSGLEQALHEHFTATRVHGEWFQASPELNALITHLRAITEAGRWDRVVRGLSLALKFGNRYTVDYLLEA